MRPFPLSLVGALLAVPAARVAAQVLTVTEFDLDRGRHAVDGRDTPALVDINSVIRVRLNKDSLRLHAAQLTGRGSGLDSLLDLMRNLQRLSSTGLAALPSFRQALDSFSASPQDPQRRTLIQDAAQPIGSVLTQIGSLVPEGTPLHSEIAATLIATRGSSVLIRVAAVFQIAAREAERIRAGVDSIARVDGVGLLLGAWIWTKSGPRPVHLPGFDDYPEGEHVVIDRWSVALSPEQQTQLQALTAQADQLRARQVDVTAALRDGLRRSVRAIADSAAACVGRLQTTLETARASASGAVRDALTTGITALDRTRIAVANLAAAYGPGGVDAMQDPTAFLAAAQTNLPALVGGLRDLHDTAVGLATTLRASSLAAREGFATTLDGCAASLGAGAASLEGDIGPLTGPLAGMLGGVRRIDTATLEFGEEVLRLDIAAAPEDTRLDLKWTGARAEGDAVIVRLGLAQRDGQPTSIEEHQLVLYRVLPHLRVGVNLIFADPVPAGLSAGRQAHFQAGPSTSVLYTWGSRRCPGYNRFWRLGIGANFAALDLNRDGTQEMGIGLALSAFAERAQAGLGYDVGQNATYWFFGLQLPLLGKTLAAPGGGGGSGENGP